VTSESDFEEFARNFQREVMDAAQDPESESFMEEQFTEKYLDQLTDIGVIEDSILCRLEGKGFKINAYNSNLNAQNNCDKEGVFFDLFVTIYSNDYSRTTVTKTEINSHIKKVRTFFSNALNKKYGKIEESNPAFDLADTIWNNRENISIAKQHQKIHVANELQLDDNDLDSLYLYFLSLKETYGNGETLPGIIDNIRKIIELKNGPSYEFEAQLFTAGYLDRHRTKYNRTGYHDREIRIFLVDKKFPRIIETDLKPGVGDVHYTIDLAVCREFRISEDDFMSDIEWIKNGS